MNELTLQLPTLEHKAAAEDFKQEFMVAQELVINGSALLDQMEYEPWLVHTTNNRKPSIVRSDWVPATTFFVLRNHDGKIIGMLDVRHNLNHEFLARYGGHIGYSVRPSERKKGYATDMLKMGLEYAKSLHIDRAMLGCYADNLASAKTIKKCGGILSETKPYLDGKSMNVYWINLE